MWAENIGRDPYTSAYQKAKKYLELGFEPVIREDGLDIIVTQGRSTGTSVIIKERKPRKVRKDKKKKKFNKK